MILTKFYSCEMNVKRVVGNHKSKISEITIRFRFTSDIVNDKKMVMLSYDATFYHFMVDKMDTITEKTVWYYDDV